MKRLKIEIEGAQLSNVVVELREVLRHVLAGHEVGDSCSVVSSHDFVIEDIERCSACGRAGLTGACKVPEKKPSVKGKRNA